MHHPTSGILGGVADLNTLALFARVVEANGFSEAARRLKMPVSTLSRRVADLEDQLGVRLLERSTRSLRLTSAGADLLTHAQHTAELSDTVHHIASNHLSRVAGTLRLSAPPSLSDSLLVPVIGAFQATHPDVHVQVFVTERTVDPVAEGVDLMFRVGPLPDPTLVSHRLLTYRHQLLASPAYLERHPVPTAPDNLLTHRLLAFSFWKPESTWTFLPATIPGRLGKPRKSTQPPDHSPLPPTLSGHAKQSASQNPPSSRSLARSPARSQILRFQPFLSMNDYAGLAQALLAGTGIGDLPPLIQPELLRSGRLVEVMPAWHFRPFDLSLSHLATRHTTQPVRKFLELATDLVPRLFPNLPA